MNQYEITIALMLAAQATTLYLLWLTKEDADQWCKAWLRESTELLKMKRERD